MGKPWKVLIHLDFSRKCYFGSRVEKRKDHFHLFYPSMLIVERLDLLPRREGTD